MKGQNKARPQRPLAQRRPQRTKRQIFQMIGWILLVLTTLSAIWLGGWQLALRIAAANDWASIPWQLGLGNFLATLVVFWAIAVTIGRLMNPRRIDFFRIIGDAFTRVAQGDFSVSVDLGKQQGNFPLSDISSGFNTMVGSLREMEEMRQEFIATVSHELQSPLTSIGGFAAALHDPALDAATRDRYLDIIVSQSQRLSRLTDSLLKLSSLESQGLAPELQSYSLDEQIRTVILAAEPQWSARNLRLEIDLEAHRITADFSALERVWTNLFHNAIKFTPPGGTISLSLAAIGGELRFDCIDSGIGVDATDLPRLFDRFYKVDKARSQADAASGSGLGLAIAKKIVELHGGRIEAASPGPGLGCRLSVWLKAQ